MLWIAAESAQWWVMSQRPTPARRILATSPFDRSPKVDSTTYALGDWVSHDRHGLGKVVGGEPGVNVIADFRGGNVVRVTLPSTMLSKLDPSEAEAEVDAEPDTAETSTPSS